ncbi:Serine/threonine-protein phosphatase 1 [Novipirellula aureliae]|uniref:Serine/threonine-protein phosphatase 1 n=1 Tax=Novipirellula aureliae TaxID=2527966 RepID=A0A5C6DS27_9BACT|nr:metallophosphoesterase family protein [Novipirellula aureliae]TWU40123.1 Serine/threonine-protein phosphatase 1 [Novipirellula aureliae]
MVNRQFVVGDIHGCSKALRTLVEAIDPSHSDQIIFLGDYVDRGPNSKDVVDQIIELRKRCRVIALRGNHEIMLMGVVSAGLDQSIWKNGGGQATIASYGGSLKKIPTTHLDFFHSLYEYHETENEIFVHACYQPDQPMSNQDDACRYWKHLQYPYPAPHFSGKRVYVGHTPQAGGEILNLGHLICLDTYCFGGGYLTAMELTTGHVIQTDKHGHRKRAPIRVLMDHLASARKKTQARIEAMFNKKDNLNRQQSKDPADA